MLTLTTEGNWWCPSLGTWLEDLLIGLTWFILNNLSVTLPLIVTLQL